jgi:hypothetical protein
MSLPKMYTLPDVGLRRVVRILRVVVFPAPFGPRKPNTVPYFTSNEMPSRVNSLALPYSFLRLVTEIQGPLRSLIDE